MRNSSEIWCETSDICLALIEERACTEVEAGNFPTMVYMSMDLYTALQNTMYSSTRYNTNGSSVSGPTIMCIMTSAGQLNIQSVNRLRNFLLVARKEDFDLLQQHGFDQVFWSDQERKRIEKAFEDVILSDEEKNK